MRMVCCVFVLTSIRCSDSGDDTVHSDTSSHNVLLHEAEGFGSLSYASRFIGHLPRSDTPVQAGSSNIQEQVPSEASASHTVPASKASSDPSQVDIGSGEYSVEQAGIARSKHTKRSGMLFSNLDYNISAAYRHGLKRANPSTALPVKKISKKVSHPRPSTSQNDPQPSKLFFWQYDASRTSPTQPSTSRDVHQADMPISIASSSTADISQAPSEQIPHGRSLLPHITPTDTAIPSTSSSTEAHWRRPRNPPCISGSALQSIHSKVCNRPRTFARKRPRHCHLEDLTKLHKAMPNHCLCYQNYWTFVCLRIEGIFSSAYRLLHNSSAFLLARCVKWKRAELKYDYNTKKVTRLSLENMLITNWVHLSDEYEISFSNMTTDVYRCYANLRSSLIELYSQTAFYFRNVNFTNMSSPSAEECRMANHWLSDTLLSDAEYGNALKQKYAEMCQEIFPVLSKSPMMYSWLTTCLYLFRKQALFLGYITKNIIDLIYDFETKCRSLESVMEEKMVEMRNELSLHELDAIQVSALSREVYTPTTLFGWTKHTAERILKLRYDLSRYSLYDFNQYEKASSAYKIWTSAGERKKWIHLPINRTRSDSSTSSLSRESGKKYYPQSSS